MNKYLLGLTATIAGALTSTANSPYIYKVLEYNPAPGQFINELPEFEPGDDYADMLAKAEEQLAGDKMPGMISLGGFGGYVIFSFDHPIINKPGDYDFKIYGNAMISDHDNNGGSAEPGIVMVSRDVNENGLPDDEWFELAGSEYYKPTTIKNYKIAYSAPESNHIAVPDDNNKYITDKEYIRWESSHPSIETGFIEKNIQHSQSYWPQWVAEKSIQFEGTRIADNYIDIGEDGSYFVQKFADWGYADNLPNSEDKGFNIDWAVDSEGKAVMLSQIDFIKVYTGVNQTCGRLGETSTEITGAEDLHPDYKSGVESVNSASDLIYISRISAGSITVMMSVNHTMPFAIYGIDGAKRMTGYITPGANVIDTNTISSGIYLLKVGDKVMRFIAL